VRLLEREGIIPPPARTTVKQWIDPENYEHRRRIERESDARRYAGEASFRLAGTSDAYRLRRLQVRELGLSVGHTAKVLTLDFGEPISEHTVARSERAGEWLSPYERQENAA
jgi:hypothetical protein